jgi:hypothetical protein
MSSAKKQRAGDCKTGAKKKRTSQDVINQLRRQTSPVIWSQLCRAMKHEFGEDDTHVNNIIQTAYNNPLNLLHSEGSRTACALLWIVTAYDDPQAVLSAYVKAKGKCARVVPSSSHGSEDGDEEAH